MVRFIFLCMAVVAIAIAAIPGMTMLNGIVKEQKKAMEIATGQLKETQNELALEQNSTSPEDLNALETAAGAETPDFDTEEIPGGFNNVAPSALGDTVMDDALDTPAE